MSSRKVLLVALGLAALPALAIAPAAATTAKPHKAHRHQAALHRPIHKAHAHRVSGSRTTPNSNG